MTKKAIECATRITELVGEMEGLIEPIAAICESYMIEYCKRTHEKLEQYEQILIQAKLIPSPEEKDCCSG
jgi:hypothetical protein